MKPRIFMFILTLVVALCASTAQAQDEFWWYNPDRTAVFTVRGEHGHSLHGHEYGAHYGIEGYIDDGTDGDGGWIFYFQKGSEGRRLFVNDEQPWADHCEAHISSGGSNVNFETDQLENINSANYILTYTDAAELTIDTSVDAAGYGIHTYCFLGDVVTISLNSEKEGRDYGWGWIEDTSGHTTFFEGSPTNYIALQDEQLRLVAHPSSDSEGCSFRWWWHVPEYDDDWHIVEPHRDILEPHMDKEKHFKAVWSCLTETPTPTVTITETATSTSSTEPSTSTPTSTATSPQAAFTPTPTGTATPTRTPTAINAPSTWTPVPTWTPTMVPILVTPQDIPIILHPEAYLPLTFD